MITQKTQFNHIKLVVFICIIILAQEIVVYSMEQKPEQQIPPCENFIEQDLPQTLALQYLSDWVIPYTNDQNYISAKLADLIEEYREYEANLKSISQNPIASVMGAINYSMNFTELKQIVKEQFKAMKQRGLIISQADFEKIKDLYFNLKHIDLTRIWGAEYLKNKINHSVYLTSKYNVPDYIIVLDDPNHIKINLSFFTRLFPIPLNLENGSIYFKHISGESVALRDNSTMLNDLGLESGIGFEDFSKPGNVIQDSETGILYIIDTEFRSFKFPISPELVNLLNYAAARFIYLNNHLLESVYEFDL